LFERLRPGAQLVRWRLRGSEQQREQLRRVRQRLCSRQELFGWRLRHDLRVE
jgi:hypothetical protein